MHYNRIDIEVVEVSDDSISDIPLYIWKISLTAELFQKFKKLAQTLLNFARQYINLKKLVVDIVISKYGSKCSQWKSNFRLHVIQEHPFYKIADNFRKVIKGIPFTKHVFRTYYSRKQVFTTLWMECAYISRNNPDKTEVMFKAQIV